MNRRVFFIILSLVIVFGASICIYGKPQDVVDVTEAVKIDPDYTDLVIPPNIAPMNFKIEENGKSYKVCITPESGNPLKVHSKDGDVRWPVKKWKAMLEANKGKRLQYDIQVQNQSGTWQKYPPFFNQVAEEDVSTHLVYRLIDPMFTQSKIMGLYDRDVTTFEEHAILQTRALDACYNCHSFYNKKSDRMMLHIRGGGSTGAAGTFIVYDGEIKKINTTTKLNPRPGAYRSWHPNGKMIAFSANIVLQFFHSTGYTQEGYDKTSDLIVYDVENNTITSAPQIADPRFMETYPEWSPDGEYLYFCRAEQPDSSSSFEQAVDKIMYDLMRIHYDVDKNRWGMPEVVLSHENTGLSITQPRISPDGRFLAFAMTKHGTFSIHRPGGDVYIMDMKTGQYAPIEGNTDRPESYNSWSHNSRWLVYSSKKRDNFLTRPYLTYIDETGKSHKSFILPQKDPTFYDTFIITYNVPEFVNERVKFDPKELIKIATTPGTTQKAQLDSTLDLDAFTAATVKVSPDEGNLLCQ